MSDVMLIGSRALNFWFGSDHRQPIDFDFFIKVGIFKKWYRENRGDLTFYKEISLNKHICKHRLGIQLEFETSSNKSVASFLRRGEVSPGSTAFGLNFHVAKPEVLLAIKQSHIHYPTNWFKHIHDYGYLRSRGVVVPKNLIASLNERLTERSLRGNTKTALTLNMRNEDFFARSEGVLKRRFAHDEIHDAVKYSDAPMFTKAKTDINKAILNKKLFDDFNYEDKCRLVREEAYVIALERTIIKEWLNKTTLVKCGLLEPKKAMIDKTLALKAYRIALMKICTTLTKGWFRDFAIKNYNVISKPDVDYVVLFLTAVASGKLRLLNGRS